MRHVAASIAVLLVVGLSGGWRRRRQRAWVEGGVLTLVTADGTSIASVVRPTQP